MATPAAGYPAAGDGRIPGQPYTPYVYRNLSDSKFNPTMAVIIIVLIGACFLLGFISVFVRKCMTDETATTTTTSMTEQSRVTLKNRGLEKAEVDALPIVRSTDLDEKGDTECPVCLTDFEPEDSLRLLPACKHVFHQECIDAWFDAHSTCPLCRASLTDQAEAPSADSSADEHGGPTVETVVEVSENGDSDIELQPAAPRDLEAPRTDTVLGPTISREVDERNSARGTLSRNSLSFKRAVRGTAALEKAGSIEAPGSKPAVTARKPPVTPATATGIRRSSSLGSDLKALRNLLTGGDQNGSSSASALKRSRSGVPSTSWFTRARSMDLGTRDRRLVSETHSRENWSTIDLETGKPKGESSRGPAIAAAGSDRAWSDRWSLARMRGAMFPLSRSTSDAASSSVNPHLPT